MAFYPYDWATYSTSGIAGDAYAFYRQPKMRYGMSGTSPLDFLGSNGICRITDMQTRTISEFVNNIPWSYNGLSTNVGNKIILNGIDNAGTLWGHDAFANSSGNNLLISLSNFGEGVATVHGQWPNSAGNSFGGVDFGANASMYPFEIAAGEKVVMWIPGPHQGRGDNYVHVFRNGVIENIKPSLAVGQSFVVMNGFTQDEYDDIWVVGYPQTSLPIESLYLWRVVSNGSSPIVGDLHLVTGLNPLTPYINPTTGYSIFGPIDHLGWEDGSFIFSGSSLGEIIKIDSSTWTISQRSTAQSSFGPINWVHSTSPPPNSSYAGFSGAGESGNYGWYLLRLSDLERFGPYTSDHWDSVAEIGVSSAIYFDVERLAYVARTTADTYWLPLEELDTPRVIGPSLSTISVLGNATGAITPPPSTPAKVIDCREGRGDLVVLGKALVLPSSAIEAEPTTLDGSLRFHDLTGFPQVFKEGAWFTLGDGGGSGGSGSGNGTSLSIDQYTIVGRTDADLGPPQQITVGAGLYIYDGVLRTTTLGGSGKLAISGAISGKLNDAETIPLGIVPSGYTASQQNSYARTIVPATATTIISIYKKTGQNAATLMGFFTWNAGETEAIVDFISTDLLELDFVFLQGSTNADASLSDFTFLIRS